MKLVFYNNNIAKILKTITGNEVFSLGPFVIMSFNESEVSINSYNHYVTHSRQWMELFLLSFFILMIINGVISVISNLVLSSISYYLIYIIELVVRRLLKCKSNVSFEVEAQLSECDPTYTEKFHLFEWIKYLFKN